VPTSGPPKEAEFSKYTDLTGLHAISRLAALTEKSRFCPGCFGQRDRENDVRYYGSHQTRIADVTA